MPVLGIPATQRKFAKLKGRTAYHAVFVGNLALGFKVAVGGRKMVYGAPC